MKTSKSDVATRQLTVRLPRDEYSRVARLAKARHVSMNGLVRQLLAELARSERERELLAAYELIGRGGEDVESAFEAQAEVARRG